MTQLRKFAVFTAIAALAMISAAQSAVLDFTITGKNVGDGISWQSQSTISALENRYTAGQGDWIFPELFTTNSQSLANLLTEKQWGDKGSYGGTGLGILVGATGSFGSGGSYIVFEDTGRPIYSYTGGLSPEGRPYNATFTTGTWTLQTSTGTDTLVVAGSSVPEPSSWGLMLLGVVGLGFVRHRRAKSAHAA
jgi:hypothetical protein